MSPIRLFWRELGCPSWGRSSGHGAHPGWVYIAEAIGVRRMKIGWTRSVSQRIATLRTANPFPIKLLGAVPGTVAEERWLHGMCVEAHAHREWFHTRVALRELGELFALAARTLEERPT